MPIPVEKDAVLVREYEVLGSPDTVAYQTYRTPVTDYNIAGNLTDHFHTSDRARANHTGTQVMATISDLPTLTATTYTPVRSAEVNLDANVTPTDAQYLRVGNTVTVSGQFTADPTTTLTTTSFELTLPVSSNIGQIYHVGGTAATGTVAGGEPIAISGSVANNTAVFTWVCVTTASQTWSYTYTYQII